MRRQPLHKLFSAMAAVLVPVALAAAPSSGFASDLSDAKSRLSSAVTEMDSLANDISSGQELCRAWQEELDSLADDVIASQGRVQGIAEKKGRAMRFLYKSGGGVGLPDFLFASQDISELLDNFSYVEEIQSWYGSLEQEERSILEETERQIADIEAKKSEQEELMLKLEQERSELASKVAEIEGQVDQLEAEQQASFSAANELAASQLFDSGDTSGWRTGVASAYGGHSDPTAPVGSHTATGDTVTESSMGVAVPMAWDNFRGYFGRKVEISYGGKSVIATVNDCGGMGGGSRSLDLQPGVFRAFGCETCDAWGLRTVSFRFL